MTTIIFHVDVDGTQTIYSDVPVRYLQIEEAAPNDRVYRRQVIAATPTAISAMIGDSPIGHAGDDRHEALSRRILGKPTVELVKGDEK